MSTAPSSSKWIQVVTTLVLGVVMSAGLWLAGARDVAFLGFVLAGLAPQTRRSGRCAHRLGRSPARR